MVELILTDADGSVVRYDLVGSTITYDGDGQIWVIAGQMRQQSAPQPNAPSVNDAMSAAKEVADVC